MLEKAIKLHSHVWRVRDEIDHTWRTPPRMDCIRYAVTEAGEAMDAWLRSTRPDDVRNHAGGADVLAELGDCAIMLASALGPFSPPTTHYPLKEQTDMDYCVHAVALLLRDHHPDNLFHGVEWALAAILAYPGFTLDIALGRLNDIYGKHLVKDTMRCTFGKIKDRLDNLMGSDVQPDTTLESLECDDDDLNELVIEVEEVFGVEIHKDIVATWRTVRDIMATADRLASHFMIVGMRYKPVSSDAFKPVRLSQDELLARLRAYEQKYGYSTDEFYRRFQNGELGDDNDLLIWAGIRHLFQNEENYEHRT